MDPQTEQRVSDTVKDILKNANMDEMTEYTVRQQASEKLGLDLSVPDRKRFVRSVVETFLQDKESENAKDQANEEEQEEEEKEENRRKTGDKMLTDSGDLIICELSSKRKVTIQEFRGKTLVSLREYYKKDGKELPTSKGISLSEEQWSVFKKNVPAIEKAIKKMESRLQ